MMMKQFLNFFVGAKEDYLFMASYMLKNRIASTFRKPIKNIIDSNLFPWTYAELTLLDLSAMLPEYYWTRISLLNVNRFLGILIDWELHFKDHVVPVKKQLGQQLARQLS